MVLQKHLKILSPHFTVWKWRPRLVTVTCPRLRSWHMEWVLALLLPRTGVPRPVRAGRLPICAEGCALPSWLGALFPRATHEPGPVLTSQLHLEAEASGALSVHLILILHLVPIHEIFILSPQRHAHTSLLTSQIWMKIISHCYVSH